MGTAGWGAADGEEEDRFLANATRDWGEAALGATLGGEGEGGSPRLENYLPGYLTDIKV